MCWLQTLQFHAMGTQRYRIHRQARWRSAALDVARLYLAAAQWRGPITDQRDDGGERRHQCLVQGESDAVRSARRAADRPRLDGFSRTTELGRRVPDNVPVELSPQLAHCRCITGSARSKALVAERHASAPALTGAAMRYYFNVKDGAIHLDSEGLDLDDLASVRQEAIKSAGEMLSGSGDHIWAGEPWRM